MTEVSIVAGIDGKLALANPWPGRSVKVNGQSLPGEVLEWEGEKGKGYEVTPA